MFILGPDPAPTKYYDPDPDSIIFWKPDPLPTSFWNRICDRPYFENRVCPYFENRVPLLTLFLKLGSAIDHILKTRSDLILKNGSGSDHILKTRSDLISKIRSYHIMKTGSDLISKTRLDPDPTKTPGSSSETLLLRPAGREGQGGGEPHRPPGEHLPNHSQNTALWGQIVAHLHTVRTIHI